MLMTQLWMPWSQEPWLMSESRIQTYPPNTTIVLKWPRTSIAIMNGTFYKQCACIYLLKFSLRLWERGLKDVQKYVFPLKVYYYLALSFSYHLSLSTSCGWSCITCLKKYRCLLMTVWEISLKQSYISQFATQSTKYFLISPSLIYFSYFFMSAYRNYRTLFMDFSMYGLMSVNFIPCRNDGVIFQGSCMAKYSHTAQVIYPHVDLVVLCFIAKSKIYCDVWLTTRIFCFSILSILVDQYINYYISCFIQ